MRTVAYKSDYIGLSSCSRAQERKHVLMSRYMMCACGSYVSLSLSPSVQVAVLERKWTNLAMAQNIRGLQKVLSNTPAIINRSDFIYGFSALHWAAKLDNSPMAELLIYNMADVNSVSSVSSYFGCCCCCCDWHCSDKHFQCPHVVGTICSAVERFAVPIES